jgi:Rrf2 family nitric oxide-sensitive transcriptional repressor
MRLTTFSDYGLRVLIFAATAPDDRATIAQVATAYGISQNHVVKVVHRLGQLGLLANTRGRGGGLRLAVAPSHIHLGRVVRALEGGDIPAECFEPEGNTCVISHACRLQGIFQEAVEAFYATLDRYTLADLVQRKAPIVITLHRHKAA